MNKEQIVDLYTILRCTVGSRLHGTQLDSQDDRDEMGIVIEPPESALGLELFEHYVHRTQPEGVRSGPGDLDLTIYSLRKWIRLALNGNPTAIALLFVPASHRLVDSDYARELRGMRTQIVSKRAGAAFLGYMRRQRQRLFEERGGRRKPARPELVEAHGYDTKYAGHVIRLGLQGVELLTTGEMTLPMREDDRETVLSVRRGEMPLEEISEMATMLEEELVNRMEGGGTPLRDQPDRESVSNWLANVHRRFWKRHVDVLHGPIQATNPRVEP